MSAPKYSPIYSSLLVIIVMVATIPAFLYRWGAVHSGPGAEALFLGFSLLGAAFLLSWAAELAQLDISQGFALAILALIAVLPEYAVDMVFAWKAGHDISFAPLALANMTGANRLLIGLGWPMVLFIFFLKKRKRSLNLEKGHYTELFYLTAATVYAFAIPFKRQLSVLDAIILIAIFAAYIVRTSRAKVTEPELIGPAAMIASMKTGGRRLMTALLFAFSGVVIFLTAEPFAESLVTFGRESGIDEFLLVQWLAPLASEAPEFMIAAIWTFRNNAQAALGALISSKVNQWTLLVGTLPIVFSLSAGAISALPLDLRQDHEIWLTAGQSIFAVAILSNLRISWYGAVLLVLLFLAQLIVSEIRMEVMFIYLLFTVVILARDRGHFWPMIKEGLRFGR